MDEIGILPKYRGHLVHDGWWSYDYYTACRHSLCGVHLLRELTFFSELSAEQKAWAAPLAELLLEIKGRVAELRDAGQPSLDITEQAAFSERYEGLIREGLEQHEPMSEPKASTTTVDTTTVENTAPPASCPKQARNLLLRMKEGRGLAVHDELRRAVRQQSGGARHSDGQVAAEDRRLLSH